MYTFLRNFIIIGLAFLLVGCGTTNEDDKTEDTETVETIETTETISEQEEPTEPKEKNLNETKIDELFTLFNAATEEVEVYDVIWS